MKLRIIDSPALPGDFNMACDYVLSRMCALGSDAILRLYTWKRPTISLGFHQKTGEIDLDKCAEDNVDVVRRPTGGRAILHWGEITYCFICPVDPADGKQLLKEVYAKVHRGLLEALSRAGNDVKFASAGRKPLPHNPLCFASAAGTELELDGKKVVGSAQRLMDSAILQHGSILLTSEHLLMPAYLNLDEHKQEVLRKKLTRQSAHLPLHDTPELRNRLIESISRTFGLSANITPLSNDQIQNIENSKDNFSILIAGIKK